MRYEKVINGSLIPVRLINTVDNNFETRLLKIVYILCNFNKIFFIFL